MNKKNTIKNNNAKESIKSNRQNKDRKPFSDDDTIWVKANENIGNIFKIK